MEITLGCQTASVSVLDSNYTEVVSFDNIKVMGDTGLCQYADNAPRHGFEKRSARNSDS
jgi:hypothetical protein